MKRLIALFAFAAAPASAQITLPFVYNALGQKVQSTAVICVDQSGNYQGCASSGGSSGGGGGAVTAASGAYALGSIVDIGTGSSPGANTVNGRLNALLSALGSPLQAGATIPVSGTFFQTTQPVSAASLPLPAGASTAAKQPALGTAGNAATDVLTVQGISGGTPQPTVLTAGSAAVGSVTVTTSTLPTGAATQTTLAAIAGQLPASLGAKTSALSLSVAPSTDGVFTVVGSRSATLTDGSGTLTTAATSQQVFAANATRAYLMIQNPITATETLFVNIGTAASTTGGSIELAPGGSLTFHNNFIPTGIVYVTAATAGHRWLAKSGG